MLIAQKRKFAVQRSSSWACWRSLFPLRSLARKTLGPNPNQRVESAKADRLEAAGAGRWKRTGSRCCQHE